MNRWNLQKCLDSGINFGLWPQEYQNPDLYRAYIVLNQQLGVELESLGFVFNRTYDNETLLENEPTQIIGSPEYMLDISKKFFEDIKCPEGLEKKPVANIHIENRSPNFSLDVHLAWNDEDLLIAQYCKYKGSLLSDIGAYPRHHQFGDLFRFNLSIHDENLDKTLRYIASIVCPSKRTKTPLKLVH